MVKLIFLCRRRADISHEQYAERLLRDHVPLALTHHPTLRRYVVNIVDHSPDGFAPLDSIGELWFDSLADFRERLYDSDEGRRIVEADVRRFMGGADAYATTEHVQKSASDAPALGTRSPGIKLMCPVQRRAEMSHADFVAHWLTRHVPLALRHHPGMSAYLTNVVAEPLSPGGAAWDGFAELYFSSVEAFASGMFDSPDGERIIRADIARFIGRTAAYRVTEYVQKW
jgi:uncharacterized protein (TIGR02118 family)